MSSENFFDQIAVSERDINRVMQKIRERWGFEVTREYAEALIKFVLGLKELNYGVTGQGTGDQKHSGE